MKAVIIANQGGIPLVSVIKDKDINEDLLSGFITALKFFGEENLGKIKEILIKGLDIDLLLVQKHDLILIAIMDSSMKKKNIRLEAEMALDSFHNKYKDEICNWKGCETIYSEFKKNIENQIDAYYKKIDHKSFLEKLRDFFCMESYE